MTVGGSGVRISAHGERKTIVTTKYRDMETGEQFTMVGETRYKGELLFVFQSIKTSIIEVTPQDSLGRFEVVSEFQNFPPRRTRKGPGGKSGGNRDFPSNRQRRQRGDSVRNHIRDILK